MIRGTDEGRHGEEPRQHEEASSVPTTARLPAPISTCADDARHSGASGLDYRASTRTASCENLLFTDL
jgi:hypothetical protein